MNFERHEENESTVEQDQQTSIHQTTKNDNQPEITATRENVPSISGTIADSLTDRNFHADASVSDEFPSVNSTPHAIEESRTDQPHAQKRSIGELIKSSSAVNSDAMKLSNSSRHDTGTTSSHCITLSQLIEYYNQSSTDPPQLQRVKRQRFVQALALQDKIDARSSQCDYWLDEKTQLMICVIRVIKKYRYDVIAAAC